MLPLYRCVPRVRGLHLRLVLRGSRRGSLHATALLSGSLGVGWQPGGSDHLLGHLVSREHFQPNDRRGAGLRGVDWGLLGPVGSGLLSRLTRRTVLHRTQSNGLPPFKRSVQSACSHGAGFQVAAGRPGAPFETGQYGLFSVLFKMGRLVSLLPRHPHEQVSGGGPLGWSSWKRGCGLLHLPAHRVLLVPVQPRWHGHPPRRPGRVRLGFCGSRDAGCLLGDMGMAPVQWRDC